MARVVFKLVPHAWLRRHCLHAAMQQYILPVTRRSFSPSAVTKEGASAETSHLGNMAKHINKRTIIFLPANDLPF